MATQQVLTPDQVKQGLKAQGKTIASWSEEHGYPARAVYRVLNGVDKANFGRAHDIAVDLQLKPQPKSTSSQHAAA